MRSVRELRELPGHDEGRLLADVDGVVADPLEATGNRDLPHSPLERLGVVDVAEHLVEHLAVRVVDEVVELMQRAGLSTSLEANAASDS